MPLCNHYHRTKRKNKLENLISKSNDQLMIINQSSDNNGNHNNDINEQLTNNGEISAAQKTLLVFQFTFFPFFIFLSCISLPFSTNNNK